ncbi:hypothetical protein PQ462_16630 [Flavobacterium sp. KACC 22758]|uniref:hypothetical protein n=1 Tax=Flavobacterium sp. KACC 22758 TaxID=3025667 RepID=UPI0023672E5F|nr:hypothetical protein [Flavobacterium sp. KACC 22758]WDF58342.1 hypothetical protein PQ462_16630 [Flavobacterium sp. KACC 22758]
MKENPLLVNIKKYDYEPIYQLQVETLYNYDIWVNDILVLTKHNNVMNTFGTFDNSFLPKSGSYKLKVKIYPNIPQGEGQIAQNEYLKNGIKFTLKVEQTAWIKGGGGLEDAKEILTYELPQYLLDENNKEDHNKPIDYSKLKEFTTEFDFTAKVPYSLYDWEDSENLTKIDTLELKKEVLAFYNDFRKSIEDGNSDFYLNNIKKAEFNYYQSNYFTIESAKSKSNKWIDFVAKGKVFEPIETGKLQFYGNGKIVSIRGIKSWDKNEGVLRYPYKKGPFNYVLVFDIFLHKPKGSDNFEFIRYTMLDKNFLKGEAK